MLDTGMSPPNIAPTIDDLRITIEMDGSNIVIRSGDLIDRSCTEAVAAALNAAADTDTTVVIDPAPVRCDDSFAAYELAPEPPCTSHRPCRPLGVSTVCVGVVRIQTLTSVWTVDIGAGRLCRTDTALDPRFLSADAWLPIIAICVTPSRLVALDTNGRLVSAMRAHCVPSNDRQLERI